MGASGIHCRTELVPPLFFTPRLANAAATAVDPRLKTSPLFKWAGHYLRLLAVACATLVLLTLVESDGGLGFTCRLVRKWPAFAVVTVTLLLFGVYGWFTHGGGREGGSREKTKH
jgi:hypothetical protein